MSNEYVLEIESGGSKEPPIIVAYGAPGIGKTTFGAAAPSPIFIQCEKGKGRLSFDAYPVAKKFEHVMAALSDLYKNPREYRTVVFDNISRLEQIVHEEIRAQHGDGIFANFARGFKLAMPYFERLLKALSALRDDRGMMVIVLAHSKVVRITPPDNDAYDRYEFDVHVDVQKVFDKWSDAILYLTQKPMVKKEDAGFNAKRGRAVGGADRVIYTSDTPSNLAKNRYDLPTEIEFEKPFDWDGLLKIVNE